MSITGQPQEINTVKSSWEVLDSPFPIRCDTSNYSTDPISKVLSPDSNTTDIHTSLVPESSGYLTEQNIEISVQESLLKYNPSPVETPEYKTKSETNSDYLIADNSFCTELKRIKSGETPRGSNSRGTAIFVSSQPRPTVDIAETIATEFENRIKKTRAAQRELKPEEALNFDNFQNKLMQQDTNNTDIQYSTEETNMSNLLGANDPNNEQAGQDMSADVSNLNVSETRSKQSREYIKLPKIGNSTNQVPNNLAPVGEQDSSNTSHGTPDKRNIIERERFQQRDRHHPEIIGSISQNSSEHQRHQLHEARNSHRHNPQHQYVSARQTENVRSQTANDHQRDTRRDELNELNGNSFVSEETDNIQPETNEVISRHTGHLSYVPIPTYHPPPTIIQNGISQSDLVELMSKGLGHFTTEMACMVLEKLKPENEALAKQVGIEVKESTVSELQDLREKLKVSESEVQTLKVERDNLIIENSKERDQMKKDFEKDKLKRVKEFEEKKELIESLQKENDKLKTTQIEKDKSLKKALGKAKSEEQRRIKLAEESENRQKELQKELGKVKGELLVQKSKKRLQVSSAQSKKECLGKLNSKHGTYVASKHFNGHMPIQYDEGDD